MGLVWLQNRGVVHVGGDDAEDFLQNLLTCNLPDIAVGQAGFGALLTPQGKILFDFILHRTSDSSFLFDLTCNRIDAFVKRLGFYRLRAKVTIDDISKDFSVAVGWGEAAQPERSLATSPDPRLPELGWRSVIAAARLTALTDETPYHAHRVALMVPEGGQDFPFEAIFPHDANMDQLNGISFSKGCYVGQEIVSRMEHRSTARTRILGASVTGTHAPAAGTEITAGDKSIGRTGSSHADKLIVMVRIDRALEALASGALIEADGRCLLLHKPYWASFAFSSEQ